MNWTEPEGEPRLVFRQDFIEYAKGKILVFDEVDTVDGPLIDPDVITGMPLYEVQAMAEQLFQEVLAKRSLSSK